MRRLMSKRIHKEITSLPWFCFPSRNPATPWVRDGRQPNEWLKLFFDLAVAAVLSVFATSHDLNTPAEIPDFLAYFTIIQWMWTSQLHYDGRYEMDDRVHRLLKGVHVLLFVFIEAASGKWNLAKIVKPRYIPGGLRDNPAERVAHVQAHNSFLTVARAVVVQRVILAGQYALGIGEGVNHLALFFQRSLSAWDQVTAALFGQVLVAIGILYCLWGFLFSFLRMADNVDPARTAIWEYLHWLLHFGIFLLYAVITNMSGISVWNHVASLTQLDDAIDVDALLDSDATQKLSTLLSRLDLDPDFHYEIWKTAFFAMALDDLELDNLMEPDDLKPVYNLVSVDWAVAIVFLAYLLTTLLTSASMSWSDWRTRKRKMQLKSRSGV
ncbi:hypothetical protein CC85DRAFT_324878 [Cutaneotrichosporon oleaginosum]|uniref:Uncharacterized protein n=1 Tax=Cutaneotrichosporon oleaginosum TaxID=879819 RepID=A0A0J0XZV4_9TREE|nr:uncharacterized protein CC85DRAFT_324878 [Cutaneotrichosporon oleaginosum]KLT46582.1 hypothetical protein CC85DRAFT_324878 [Cutaneotrichosporon oleaginosum]TXT15053.1 hypothetical protein COLE_01246 [Cutaneotrichosporon oleaginosum]